MRKATKRTRRQEVGHTINQAWPLSDENIRFQCVQIMSPKLGMGSGVDSLIRDAAALERYVKDGTVPSLAPISLRSGTPD